MKEQLTDTKPRNYDYLTFTIISSISHDGKVQLLKSLEKMLLKSIVRYPIKDDIIPMENVQTFSGKDQGKVLSIWYMEVMPKKKLSQILMRVNRTKFN
jgi:hypothetical protein